MSPEYQARLDWATTGSFNPDKFKGDDRVRYESEALKIIQQWDNQL